jgi:hypothetical protein
MARQWRSARKCHRGVWPTGAACLLVVLRCAWNGLTTQAQRPGPRDAWIATGARWPGSLQRMVRPRRCHTQKLRAVWQRNHGKGIEDSKACVPIPMTNIPLPTLSGTVPSDLENRITETSPRRNSRRENFNAAKWSNGPSSATRPAGRVDCNRSAMAGFAAAHG